MAPATEIIGPGQGEIYETYVAGHAKLTACIKAGQETVEVCFGYRPQKQQDMFSGVVIEWDGKERLVHPVYFMEGRYVVLGNKNFESCYWGVMETGGGGSVMKVGWGGTASERGYSYIRKLPSHGDFKESVKMRIFVHKDEFKSALRGSGKVGHVDPEELDTIRLLNEGMDRAAGIGEGANRLGEPNTGMNDN